jgi:hypothetical protein
MDGTPRLVERMTGSSGTREHPAIARNYTSDAAGRWLLSFIPPRGAPGGGITSVEVGPGSVGTTCILGSTLPPGLMTPRDLSSLSLGLSFGAGCVPCAADGVEPYTSAVGTSRHFTAMHHFGRFQSEADMPRDDSLTPRDLVEKLDVQNV